MEIVNHKLVEGGKVTPFVKAAKVWGVIPPSAIIIHYTAGPSGQASVKLFASPSNKTSAHIVAHEDGKITQMVDFNKMAAHAGESSWRGMTSFNRFSIGIEISNWGYLVKNPKGDGFVNYMQAKSLQPKTVSEDMIFVGKHRNAVTTMTHWHKYTQAQIDSVFELCEAICKAYPIKWILGHEEIAVGRKADPGPAFPLDELRARLKPFMVAEEKMETTQVVSNTTSTTTTFTTETKSTTTTTTSVKIGTTTAKVNIRKGADLNAAKVTNPILEGTKIEIIGESGDWYNVLHQITGWVYGDSIKHNETNDEQDGEITVEGLNIRVEPNDAAEPIAEPLKKGTKIYLIHQKDGWYQLNTKVVGYVVKKFVQV